MPATLAEYMRRPIVRDRNLAALLKWSAFVTQTPPAGKPSDDEARLRIVAERIPMQLAQYVERTLPWMMKDETTQTNLRLFLSDLNSDAEEASLADQLSGIIARQMPPFARADVSEAQLQQWYRDNGWPPETPEPMRS